MAVAKQILELVKGGQFYLDTSRPDPLKMSAVINSTQSENMISIACYRGDYSAVHCIVEEFPSINPKRWGQQKKKVTLFDFYTPADIAHWMDIFMDSPTPFYPKKYKTYYAGLENGLPNPYDAAAAAPAVEAA